MVAPFIFFHLGQRAEAIKSKPVLVAEPVQIPQMRDNGNIQFNLPVVNRGAGPAYDVRSSYEGAVMLRGDIEEHHEDPVLRNEQRGPAILASGSNAYLPVVIATGDFPPLPDGRSALAYIRSGEGTARVRVKVTFRDDQGSEHEYRLCLFTLNAELPPAYCSTGWEGEK